MRTAIAAFTILAASITSPAHAYDQRLNYCLQLSMLGYNAAMQRDAGISELLASQATSEAILHRPLDRTDKFAIDYAYSHPASSAKEVQSYLIGYCQGTIGMGDYMLTPRRK